MCLLCIIWYQTAPTRIASNPSEKSLEGVYTFNFYAFFYKKKKAGGVSIFFVFGDTSHLFCLYTYYNAIKARINRQCATL